MSKHLFLGNNWNSAKMDVQGRSPTVLPKMVKHQERITYVLVELGQISTSSPCGGAFMCLTSRDYAVIDEKRISEQYICTKRINHKRWLHRTSLKLRLSVHQNTSFRG